MNTFRWQDLLIASVAVWLMSSLLALDYADHHAALNNATFVGVLLMVLAGIAFKMLQRWEELASIGLGGWLVISPWALEISAMPAATLNAVMVGIAVMALAMWALIREFEAAELRDWWQRLRPHSH